MTKEYCVIAFINAPTHVTKYVYADSEDEAKQMINDELIMSGELDYKYIVPNIKYKARQIKRRKAA